MALNLDFTLLSTYTDQLTLPIIRQTILPSTLTSLGINYQENVTGTSVLNIMGLNLVVKAGGNCAAFAGTTGSSLYQTNISVSDMLVENEDCPDKFKKYWTKIITDAGSYAEADPNEYAKIYTAYLLEAVKARVEDYFWSGSTTGTYSTQLTAANGILYNLEVTNAGAFVAGATAYSGALTVANAINAFYDARNKLPNNVIGAKDLIWAVPHSDYFTLTQAAAAANFYNPILYSGSERENDQLMIKGFMGTNVTVVAQRGLDYKNKRVMTRASNLYLGTDLSSDFEKIRVWYSFDNNTVRTQIKWKQGAIVAFPAECVVQGS